MILDTIKVLRIRHESERIEGDRGGSGL